MPIDFFKATCKTESTVEQFGLCDDPPPASNPAYIDENNSGNWIATVINSNKKKVEFHAIDSCVEILKPDGTLESRCDGILHHDTELIFVELKDRGAQGWLKKGCSQLTITYTNFVANHNITGFKMNTVYVANKQRPLIATNISNHIQQIKDDTGLILKVQNTIEIL
jgi:hypothetical protein